MEYCNNSNIIILHQNIGNVVVTLDRSVYDSSMLDLDKDLCKFKRLN